MQVPISYIVLQHEGSACCRTCQPVAEPVSMLQNLSACCRTCQQMYRCWIFISLFKSDSTSRDYQLVKKRVHTFSASIIATYSRQLFIKCIIIPAVKVCGKIRFYYLAQISHKKILKKHFFFDYCCRRRHKCLLIECGNIYYGQV